MLVCNFSDTIFPYEGFWQIKFFLGNLKFSNQINEYITIEKSCKISVEVVYDKKNHKLLSRP